MMDKDRKANITIYSLSKLGFILTHVIFIVLFIIAMIVGILAPETLIYQPEKFPEPQSISKQWEREVVISRLNYRIALQGLLAEGGEEPRSTATAQGGTVSTYELYFVTLIQAKDYYQDTLVLLESEENYRKFECDQIGRCKHVVLASQVYLREFYGYKFSIIGGSSNAFTADLLSHYCISYRLVFMNDRFVIFRLVMCLLFIMIAVMVMAINAIKLKAFKWKDGTTEQRWAMALLLFLVAFNFPGFFVSILVDRQICVYFDQMLKVSFLTCLMLFWMEMLFMLRVSAPTPILSRSSTRIFLLTTFWISGVLICTWNELWDMRTGFDNAPNEKSFVFFIILKMMMMIVYLVLMAYAVFRAILSNEVMNVLSFREKWFDFFGLLVLTMVMAGIAFDQFSPINHSVQYVSFWSLINLYVYFLVFMYYPSVEVVMKMKSPEMVELDRIQEEEDGS